MWNVLQYVGLWSETGHAAWKYQEQNLSYFPSCKTGFISPTSLGDRQMLKDKSTGIILQLKN